MILPQRNKQEIRYIRESMQVRLHPERAPLFIITNHSGMLIAKRAPMKSDMDAHCTDKWRDGPEKKGPKSNNFIYQAKTQPVNYSNTVYLSHVWVSDEKGKKICCITRIKNVRVCRMPHRKWRETKQQPRRAKSGNQISCSSVSLNFLCDILRRNSSTNFFPSRSWEPACWRRLNSRWNLQFAGWKTITPTVRRTQNVNLQSEVIFYAEAPNDDARGLLKKEGYRLPSRDALFIIQLMIKRLFSNIWPASCVIYGIMAPLSHS